MKKNLPLLLFTVLLLACRAKKHPVVPAKPALDLTVVAYDISISFDSYATMQGTHLDMLYRGIATGGGGKFYGVQIKSNSLKQDPLECIIPPVDTLPAKGNIYQKRNRQKQNNRLITRMDTLARNFVTMVSGKMLLPKNEAFSDVQHALELARDIFNNPVYAGYTKTLIIISDLENDFPPVDGIDKMDIVSFLSDVRIIIVRPSRKVSIPAIIGTDNYTVYTTIDDAINSSFQNVKK